jgi:hypothetical protein
MRTGRIVSVSSASSETKQARIEKGEPPVGCQNCVMVLDHRSGFKSLAALSGLPTELAVSYRQNCGGDLIFSMAPGSDTGADRCLA